MKIRMIPVLLMSAFLFTMGCAAQQPKGPQVYEKSMPLDTWVEHSAAPYLIKELGQNPIFENRPFLIVSLDEGSVNSRIDDLTADIRETLTDYLLTEPGLRLVRRPSARMLKHHTSLSDVRCRLTEAPQIYVGIDTSISPVDDELTVKIRALDIQEDRWISGFGTAWKGKAEKAHKQALETENPDDFLLGMRPLPFTVSQGDLLAAYLTRNLSCLFKTMETSEIRVHVKKDIPGRMPYFENSFAVMKNYLAKFRQVMVTDDPAHANIRVTAEVRPIHPGLFQVWLAAKRLENGTYVPGRVTEAYAAVDTNTGEASGESETSVSADADSDPGAHDFTICCYDYKPKVEDKVYDIMTDYPGVTAIDRLYGRYGSRKNCTCYGLATESDRYGSMESLTAWFQDQLDRNGSFSYTMKPESPERLNIFMNTGFE